MSVHAVTWLCDGCGAFEGTFGYDHLPTDWTGEVEDLDGPHYCEPCSLPDDEDE